MNVTKRPILCTALLIFLSALPALAADITGTWTSLVKAAPPNGNDMLLTLVFKQEGARLSGTVSNPHETGKISNGKVDGDKISFAVTMSVATFTYEGTVTGDEIKMTIKADNPDFPPGAMTLTRSK